MVEVLLPKDGGCEERRGPQGKLEISCELGGWVIRRIRGAEQDILARSKLIRSAVSSKPRGYHWQEYFDPLTDSFWFVKYTVLWRILSVIPLITYS
jgi:hypothetical protein